MGQDCIELNRKTLLALMVAILSTGDASFAYSDPDHTIDRAARLLEHVELRISAESNPSNKERTIA